jgi:hypothetical protein
MLARMRMFVKPCLALCFALSLLIVGKVAAEPEKNSARWVPGFSFQSGVNAQNGTGTLSTSDVLDPYNPGASSTLDYSLILPGTPQDASSRLMTPYGGISVEIMTPTHGALGDAEARSLRGFAHIDLSYSFGPDYNLPATGNPGPFISAIPSSASLTQGAIIGQGGRTIISVNPFLLTAGAGVAFSFRAWDRVMRIKPSMEYLRQEISLRGLARRAVRVDPTPNALPGTPDDTYFRTVNLSGQTSRVYHGLGPGLEIEVETGRAGNFVVALYASAKAWTFLNNEDLRVETFNDDTLNCPPPPPGQVNCSSESATFGYSQNDWAYGGSLGLRFRWSPE